MPDHVSDIAFTETVKAIQQSKGSRDGYAKMENRGGWQQAMPDHIKAFIGERDSFYLGTANGDGQPYIQHRGGKPGFLKVLDDRTLGFADFTGNRQYITAGNLRDNDKAYIFLMDYGGRRRVKIWGTAHVSNDGDQINRLVDDDYDGVPEQAILFNVLAWDVNCPQHIPEKYSKQDVVKIVHPLQQRIDELQKQLAVFQRQRDNKA